MSNSITNTFNTLTLFVAIGSAAALTGCATDPNGRVHAKCDNGTNYAGAVVGALGGAAVGSMIGGGTGNVLATGAGAAAGGIAGSKSNIGCR